MSMQTDITVRPQGVGEIGHGLGGDPDDPIPILRVGPVQVVFYDFEIEPGQMSAWLADLSAHALELAAEIDAKWPIEVSNDLTAEPLHPPQIGNEPVVTLDGGLS